LCIVAGNKTLWDELQSGLTDLPARVLIEQTSINEWTQFREKLDRLSVDAVLLDASSVSEPLDQVIGRIRSIAHPPHVIVLHPNQDAQAILTALRAGATEFLFPPFADQLKAALERIAAERHRDIEATKSGGRAIGFVSAKGGCGATTIAAYTATRLAVRWGQKSLIADLDSEAGMIGFLFKSASPYSSFDALRNVQRLDTNYWSALVSNGIPNLEVLAGPPPPAPSHSFTSEQIRYVLHFGRKQYGWVVADLGRGITEFSMRVFEELDDLFLVTTMEIPALHRSKQMAQRLLQGGLAESRLKLLLNRAPKRSDLTLDEIRSAIGIPVFATVPNDYGVIQDAYAERTMAPATTALGRGIDELVNKIGGFSKPDAVKKKFSLFG
jgi:pilus assembly protein CpaE